MDNEFDQVRDLPWAETVPRLVKLLSQAIAEHKFMPSGDERDAAQALVDSAIRHARDVPEEGEAVPGECEANLELHGQAACVGAVLNLVEFLKNPSAQGDDIPFDGAELQALCAEFAPHDRDFDFEEWTDDVLRIAIDESLREIEVQSAHDDAVEPSETGSQDAAERPEWRQCKNSWLEAIPTEIQNQKIPTRLPDHEVEALARDAFNYARTLVCRRYSQKDPLGTLRNVLERLIKRFKDFDPNANPSFRAFLMSRVLWTAKGICDPRGSADRESQKRIETFYQSKSRPVPDSANEIYNDFRNEFHRLYKRFPANETDLTDCGLFLGLEAIKGYLARRAGRNIGSLDSPVGGEEGSLSLHDIIADESTHPDYTRDTLEIINALLWECDIEIAALLDSGDAKQRRDLQIFRAYWANDLLSLIDLVLEAGLPLPPSLWNQEPATQAQLAEEHGFERSAAVAKIVTKVALQLCAIIRNKCSTALKEGVLPAIFPRAFKQKGSHKDPTDEYRRALKIIHEFLGSSSQEHPADQTMFHEVHLPRAVQGKLHPRDHESSTRLIDLDPEIGFSASRTLDSVVQQFQLDPDFAIRRLKGIIRRIKDALVEAEISDAIVRALTKWQLNDTE